MASQNYIVGQQDITDPAGWVDSGGNVPPLVYQNVPQNTNYPLNGDGRYWWKGNALNPPQSDITFIGSDTFLVTSAALTWQITQFATDGSTPAIIYSTNGGVSFTQIPLAQALQSGEVTVDFITTSASGLSVTSASPAVISWPNFPGAAGMLVNLSGTLPSSLSSATSYYVVAATTSSFEVSLTLQGTPINTLSSSSAVTAQLAPNGFIWGVDIIQPNPPSSLVVDLGSVQSTTHGSNSVWGYSDGTVPIVPDSAVTAAFGTLTSVALASGYDINVLAFADNVGSSSAVVQLSITGLAAAPLQGAVYEVSYTGDRGAQTFLSSSATYTSAGDTATWTWPATFGGDPIFDDVSLLMHFDGNFTDVSKNDYVFSDIGTPVISSSTAKFGGGAFYNNGSGSNLLQKAIVANGPLDLSSGDWTIEFWWNAAVPDDNIVIDWCQNKASGIDSGLWIEQNGFSNNVLQIYVCEAPNTTINISTNTLSTSAWQAICFQRRGAFIEIYVDGAFVRSTALAANVNLNMPANPYVCIGGSYGNWGSVGMAGYMDELRVTKGAARYTSAGYSEQIAEFVSYSNTEFLAGDIYDVTLSGSILAPTSKNYQVAVACTRNVTQAPVFDYPNPFDATNYNGQAMDASGYPSQTLGELRQRLMIGLGYAMQAANPPLGMVLFCNDKLLSAQNFLYRRYQALHTRRFFRWKLIPGQRFYSLKDNDEDVIANFQLDPNKAIEWAGIQDTRNVWYPLIKGIAPQLYTMLENPWRPARYDIGRAIEVYPAPDQTYWLWIKGNLGLMSFVNDTDTTTLDSELVYLFALATAKAHYGQPDANNIASMANTYRGELIAGTHATGHYVPGTIAIPPAVRPTLIGYQSNQGQ